LYCYRHAGDMGEKQYSTYSLLASALDGLSTQRQAPAALYPRYPLDRRLGGLKAGLDTEAIGTSFASAGDRIPVTRPSSLWSDTVLTVFRPVLRHNKCEMFHVATRCNNVKLKDFVSLQIVQLISFDPLTWIPLMCPQALVGGDTSVLISGNRQTSSI
jgi:hypothetical protein